MLILLLAELFLSVALAGPAMALSLPDSCGNVNGSDSGDVTTADALLVLKRAVGQNVEMVCGPTGLPVRTGQANSFGTGDDGNRRDGAPRTFVDNGDGTITDLSTGLMWEKKDRSGGVHDSTKLYTWSTGTNSMDGTMVSNFLATLNAGGGFAGYTNWRIPNRFELETLLNLGSVNPSIHFPFNQSCVAACTLTNCSCTSGNFHWTSSSTTEPTIAWGVRFSDGDVGADGKTGSGAVRAVRSVQEIPNRPVCEAPEPPQCSFNDPCTQGRCSVTHENCSVQSDCPLSPDEQCCCAGTCL